MESIFGTYGEFPPRENVTGAAATIDSNHGQIHAGNGFSVFARIVELAAAASEDFALIVPENAYVHFQLADLNGDGSAEFNLYENATLVAGAVKMAPSNRHRRRNDASVLEFRAVSSVSATGTLVDGFSLYTGNQRGSTTNGADGNEWVLRPGTYLLRVTSRAQVSLNATLRLFWYEEARD